MSLLTEINLSCLTRPDNWANWWVQLVICVVMITILQFLPLGSTAKTLGTLGAFAALGSGFGRVLFDGKRQAEKKLND